jgi:hypothetical protein
LTDFGLRLVPGVVSGEITSGELTLEGATLTGWVKLSAEAQHPVQIIIVSSGQVVGRVTLAEADPLVPQDFQVVVPESSFRPPLYVELSVYAADATTSGAELPMKGTAAELALARVGSRQDFLKLVQSPTERLKSANLLFYVSYHGVRRLLGDFAAQSAGTCVMGYRIIDGLVVPDAARKAFWDSVEQLLVAKPNVPRGLWLRWHTSVRLVAGYVAFREKDTERSASYFDGIGDFAFELAHWPAALTNILIGIFLAGWVRYERGEFVDANQSWRRAEGVLRYGAALSQLPNFYAYGEFANAIRVAQECYIGCQQAENGGAPVHDVRIIPSGYELDIRHLSGLRYNLGLS